MQIVNPVLPGFNPDPSICRAGEDYYIATSTFEWFPGVQIHHSRDLVHWRLLTRPLSEFRLLDMRGNPDSGGIWAPCLSYHDGLFYLVYTDVKSKVFSFLDCHNYLTTAPTITGPWSDPVYLSSSGFDPSLFHDDDGLKWVTMMQWDYRGTSQLEKFGGILLQQYSMEEKRLVGPITKIFTGTAIGSTEGPHIYKRNEWYYLMVAEGGTGYGHAVSTARSKCITGPYVSDPGAPILSSRDGQGLELQKSGHASLVNTPNDCWYLAHLCGRPISEERRCTLGRETAIQTCYWTEDGWLRVEGKVPRVTVPSPELPAHAFPPEPARITFDCDELDINFQALRTPVDESWCSLKERSGFLRLRGRESLVSLFDQSLVARRLQSHHATVTTEVEFEPSSFQHLAGLVCYYHTKNWYYLYLSHDEQYGKIICLACCDNGKLTSRMIEPMPISEASCMLRAVIDHEALRFFWGHGEDALMPIGPQLDATILSDEYCDGFTGAFIGICCQDLSTRQVAADFRYFEYSED